ncbi:MAG: RidA family protein [Oscillospiraceae bacterium]|jgi:2-iminobutanoate/2-iminopropanoate deaminase
MKEIITAPGAPAAIGPYSHAVRSSGALYFTSGQIPLVPETGTLVSGDFSEQAEQVMKNLEAVLRAGGLGFGDVVKTMIFVTDLKNFPVLNEIYGRYVGKEPPARSCVEVSSLPAGALLEVEMIATY